MKGKRFDPEFKKDIEKLYINGDRTCASLAEELGIHVNTTYKWVEQYKEDPEHAFPGSGKLKPDEEELRKSQCKIKELENEIAILKQTAVETRGQVNCFPKKQKPCPRVLRNLKRI